MLRKKQEVDRERSELYPQNAEMAMEWESEEELTHRVTYVEEVLEESEVVV